MNYYLIENEGEIDINALRLIGATSKDGETQIGYFGTGIKYALATAMRKGIPIEIFSGETQIGITTKSVPMRGLDFDVICINGEMTSITTEMGRDWETWFILREFYCNAIDEGSSEIVLTDQVSGENGKTRVYIGMVSEMHDIMMKLDEYFSPQRTPEFEADEIKVFHRSSDEHMTIYRRGVRVFGRGNSIYDYDIHDLKMSEARVSEIWDINWKLIKFWKRCATPEMITALYSNHNSHEFSFSWDYHSDEKLCDAWWLTLMDKVIIPQEQSGYFADDLSEFHIVLPYKLCVELHKTFGSKLNIRGMLDDGVVINETEITARESSYIDRALDFLSKTEYFSEIDKEIIRVAVMDEKTWGQAHNGLIYLSPEVFKKGLKSVVAVIIEEWLHIKSKASDRTRLFQDTLIEITISVLEEQSGVYL